MTWTHTKGSLSFPSTWLPAPKHKLPSGSIGEEGPAVELAVLGQAFPAKSPLRYTYGSHCRITPFLIQILHFIRTYSFSLKNVNKQETKKLKRSSHIMHTEMGTVNTCYRFPWGDASHLTWSQLRPDCVCNPSFRQQWTWNWLEHSTTQLFYSPATEHLQTISLHLKQRPKLLLLFSRHKCAQRLSLFSLLKAGKPLVYLSLVRYSSWCFVILAGVLLLAYTPVIEWKTWLLPLA